MALPLGEELGSKALGAATVGSNDGARDEGQRRPHDLGILGGLCALERSIGILLRPSQVAAREANLTPKHAQRRFDPEP